MPKEPMPDGGFTVDPAQLSGVAGQAGRCYDELTTAITQFCSFTPVPSALGSDEVANAWLNFENAWTQELNVLGLALTEMIGKLQAAGGGYAKADSASTAAIGGVAGQL